MFIHSRNFPKNYTRFQTKMGKSLPFFWPERPKIHTLWGSTNLYGLYKEETPPPPSPHPRPWRAGKAQMKYSQTLYRHELNMDTSMLWTVSCVAGERKPLHFLLLQSAQKGPVSASNKGNRRRLHAGNKMRDYMDKRVTPPKRIISPTSIMPSSKVGCKTACILV